LIEIRCFEALADAAGLRHDIDALNQRSARPDPFSTFAYYEVCGQPGAAGGTRLWFLTASRDGRLIGYLALRLVEERWLGLSSRKLEFLITEHNDRPHLVAEPAELLAVSQACYRYLLGRQQDWCWLELARQEPGSALFPPPAAVDLTRHRVSHWSGPDNWTIALRWESLGDYFRALSKKFRANLRRQTQGLQAAGRLEWLSSADPASAAALLELYLSIETHSWKAHGASRAALSLGGNALRLDQLRGLLGAGQPMRLEVQVLLLDGLPIAGLITGAYLRRLYALHIVHDQRLDRYGPGSLMLLLAMQTAIGGGCTHFDLLAGFGYYKQRWLADPTPSDVGQIYRIGSLADWRRRAGDLLRRWGRSAPRLPAATGRRPDPEVDAPARIAALLRQARAGAVDSLSPAGLAAALPFLATAAPPSAESAAASCRPSGSRTGPCSAASPAACSRR
jgi:CelD/BcsL family acetyltransferase involved in cellulose biosynthesis